MYFALVFFFFFFAIYIPVQLHFLCYVLCYELIIAILTLSCMEKYEINWQKVIIFNNIHSIISYFNPIIQMNSNLTCTLPSGRLI